MRPILTFLLVLLMATGALAKQYRKPPTQADWPFCRVQYTSPNGGSYAGTGTQIDSSGGRCLIITNYHVIADASRQTNIRCTFLTGKRVTSGKVVYVDRAHDLAAIVATCAGADSAVIAPFTSTQDTYIYGGFGSGQFRQVQGRVKERKGLPQGAKYRTVLLSASVRSGDSGGAVLNRKRCMVGVVWGTDADGSGSRATMGKPFMNFCVRLMQYCQNGQCFRPSDSMQRQVQYGQMGLDPLQFASTGGGGAPLFNAPQDAPNTFTEDPVQLPGAPPERQCCQDDGVISIQPVPNGGGQGIPFIMQGTLWMMPGQQVPPEERIQININRRHQIDGDKRAQLDASKWKQVGLTCSSQQQQMARLWFMQQQSQSANFNRQLQMMMMMRHMRQQQQTVAWVQPRFPLLWWVFGGPRYVLM